MLSIGPIQLDVPFVQAALSGYSDAAMRGLAREYGCPYALNEVVLDRLVGLGGKKMSRMLAVAANDHPVGGQLMGCEPDELAAATVKLMELGYDAVDINFGCPVRKVLSRKRGGFLLSQPTRAIEIIRRVLAVASGRVPVTLKLRRGTDASCESERSFFTILETAFELGVAAVTVHARTVEQRYVGPSDWSFLARIKRHVGGSVILGSGDLFTATDCVRMIEETGVDGCSIARGAIGNPFIFSELRALISGKPLPPAPSIEQQRAALERHLELLMALRGPAEAVRVFRKFGVRYSELHPCRDQVKAAFVQLKREDDWRALLDRWYSPAATYPPVVRRHRPESLVAAGAALHGGEEAS